MILYYLQRFLRSFSNLGTDRHRPAPLPTPGAGTSTGTVTSTCRQRPATTGTDRHRTGTDWHDIHFDYLVVNNVNYQFLKKFFSFNNLNIKILMIYHNLHTDGTHTLTGQTFSNKYHFVIKDRNLIFFS